MKLSCMISFRADGLHEFIIDLRVMLHHLYSAKPGYRWEKRFEEDAAAKVHFDLSRDDLIQAARDIDDKRLAKLIDYLAKGPQNIDLKHVGDEYRKRAIVFHSWFRGAIRNCDAYEAVRDYERCVLENRRFAS